jgi:nicotinamide mononucleotide transporter
MFEHIDWRTFSEGIISASWLEWISVISQLVSVWYAKRNNWLVYPTGLIGVLIAFYLYLWKSDPPLYADSILNLYYGLMSLYGWYRWTRKNEHAYQYPIRYASKKTIGVGLVIFLLGWVLIAFALTKFTDSNTPIMDACVTSSAIIGMWWMAQRNIEHWIAWICSNLIAIPLNVYKGFVLYAIMYFLLLVLAIRGWYEWRNKIDFNEAD